MPLMPRSAPPGLYRPDDDFVEGFFWRRVEEIKSIALEVWLFLAWSFYSFRSVYLNAVTLGAWKNLGSLVLDQAAELEDIRVATDRATYRLDCFMRLVEQDLYVVIPSDIEPPRDTTFGEGIPIGQEQHLVKKSLDTIRRQLAGESAALGGEREGQEAQVPVPVHRVGVPVGPVPGGP